MTDLKICGFHIIIGDSISKILNPRTNAVYINKVKDIYNDKKYIIHPDTGNRVMYVFPKEDASVDDMLCAYFQSVLLAIITCAINDHQLVRNLHQLHYCIHSSHISLTLSDLLQLTNEFSIATKILLH